MKRYLVFFGDCQHPDGGWDDFKGSFDTIEEAREFVKNKKINDWFQIIDYKHGEKLNEKDT